MATPDDHEGKRPAPAPPGPTSPIAPAPGAGPVPAPDLAQAPINTGPAPVQPVLDTPPVTLDGSPPSRRVFTVGTLVYTTSGLVVLFVWLLWGDFALSMRERSVGPLVELFLLKQGASNTLKQVLTATLPTVIGLVLGPIISYQSDRYRSRWGRRIPFLIIPTPIAGLAMVGIAFSQPLGIWLHQLMVQPMLFERALATSILGGIVPGTMTATGVGDAVRQQLATGYTMTVFTVFWTVFEVAVITSGAVMGGLINDVVPRPVLGRFHGLFRAVSLFDGILFNALLFKHAEQHFTLMFALIGLLFGGGFTLMCLMVREGNYPPPPAEEPALARAGRGGLFGWIAAFVGRFFSAAAGYLRECFTQPYYLLCFAMFTLAGLTFNPINSFTFRYKEQLGMSTEDYGFLIAGSYLCSLVIAFPLGMIVDRVHALRATLAAVALYSLTALYGSLFIDGPTTFGIALVAHTILSGTYFTCAASLPQQLLPRSKYSQYASAGAMVTSIAGLIFAPSIGALLDATDNNYRLTFWAGLILSLVTIALMLVVYRRFNRYGGVGHYVAPGDTDGPAPQHEPPAHLTQTIALYLVGALVGGGLGYALSFLVHPPAGTSFGQYPSLLIAQKPIRDLVLLWIAVGVLPGAALGAMAGNRMAKRAHR